jgi:F0F1-type ATP synthase membrane subunit b/b'
MKLTESRIKEIIQEEVEKAQQEQDEAKTMQEFKQFLINLAKQSNQIKGASPQEIQALAQHIIKIVKTLGKGEISTYIQKTDEFFSSKTGNK